MPARLLDGLECAAHLKESIRLQVAALRKQGIAPGLGTLLVGDNPASRSYVSSKHRDCAEVGIESISIELPAQATSDEIEAAISQLNADPAVSGFIVQLPLPDGIDEQAMLALVDPSKDADGLHPMNLGKLVMSVNQRPYSPIPCTPAGILELLEFNGIDLSGQKVVIVGRGITVGRPLSLLLAQRGIDATVVVTHSRTPDIGEVISEGDVIVAALGVPHFVRAEWVKQGAVVIDVGVTRIGTTESGKAKLAGDVSPDVRAVASWISPNPGGVGPMTRAMLLSNVVQLATRSPEYLERNSGYGKHN